MFTKLANSILTSTVWMESNETRIVWLTLLAMCDKNGEVQASIPGLANVARVSIEDCEAAIALFLAPDRYSRTKTSDGRRIEEIDGGWVLLNHEKYRELGSDSDRRAKAAERQRRFRERHNGESGALRNVTGRYGALRDVTGDVLSRQIPHTDTDADTDAVKKKDAAHPKKKAFTPPTVEQVSEYCRERGNHVDPQQFVDHYQGNGWMRGKNKIKDWKACVRTWERNSNNGGTNGQRRSAATAAYDREAANASAFASLKFEDDD